MDPKLVYWTLARADPGAVAGICAWRLRSAALLLDGPPTRRMHRAHRLAGRVAVASCLLAFVTASFVLTDMYARAGV